MIKEDDHQIYISSGSFGWVFMMVGVMLLLVRGHQVSDLGSGSGGRLDACGMMFWSKIAELPIAGCRLNAGCGDLDLLQKPKVFILGLNPEVHIK